MGLSNLGFGVWASGFRVWFGRYVDVGVISPESPLKPKPKSPVSVSGFRLSCAFPETPSIRSASLQVLEF